MKFTFVVCHCCLLIILRLFSIKEENNDDESLEILLFRYKSLWQHNFSEFFVIKTNINFRITEENTNKSLNLNSL